MIRRDNLLLVTSDSRATDLQTSDFRQTDLLLLASDKQICNVIRGVVNKFYSKLHMIT